MTRPIPSALALAAAATPLAIALITAAGRAQTRPEPPARQVYESSIGGVVSASNLPGRQGQGYLVFSKWCAGCHAPDYAPPKGSANGADVPDSARFALGTNILRQRYGNAEPAALEERTDLAPELVGAVVRNGINAMPAFRKTEISDAELTALSAYLTRNTKPAAPANAPSRMKRSR